MINCPDFSTLFLDLAHEISTFSVSYSSEVVILACGGGGDQAKGDNGTPNLFCVCFWRWIIGGCCGVRICARSVFSLYPAVDLSPRVTLYPNGSIETMNNCTVHKRHELITTHSTPCLCRWIKMCKRIAMSYLLFISRFRINGSCRS